MATEVLVDFVRDLDDQDKDVQDLRAAGYKITKYELLVEDDKLCRAITMTKNDYGHVTSFANKPNWDYEGWGVT